MISPGMSFDAKCGSGVEGRTKVKRMGWLQRGLEVSTHAHEGVTGLARGTGCGSSIKVSDGWEVMKRLRTEPCMKILLGIAATAEKGPRFELSTGRVELMNKVV
jgi:hypothetical protein